MRVRMQVSKKNKEDNRLSWVGLGLVGGGGK